VPGWPVHGRVQRPLRHRGQVLPCPVPVALAARLPLPGLHWTGPLAVSARGDGLLPVPRLPAPDHADRRHDVRGHQAAAAHWLLALHLLTATKTNLAALELMRHLGARSDAALRPALGDDRVRSVLPLV